MTNEKRSVALVASSQAEMPLIDHEVENRVVRQRASDGYINATAMCEAAEKRFYDYRRQEATREFLEALGSKTGIPVFDLVKTIKGGNRPELRGIWVHPRVAINLAQWLSPTFAVQVTEWVFEWLSGRSPQGHRLPDHVRRYLVNRPKIPPTHFSMLDQMTLRLLAPLEDHGYALPTKLMPDIALGRMFSRWLRDDGHDPDSFPTYSHRFLDHRPDVNARLYPNELMTAFNLQLDNWLRGGRARDYFGERDADAIMPLDRVLSALPAPSADDLPTLGTGDPEDE